MTHLRFALAQIDTCVGDLDGNADKIMHYAHLAAHEGAHVVIFPEMTLTGYPIEDLALRRTFRKAAWDKANWLATELEADGLGDLYVAVGTVGTDHASDKPRNRMVVLHDGMVWAGYDKHFLPNYGVFDEFRIFAAGRRAGRPARRRAYRRADDDERLAVRGGQDPYALRPRGQACGRGRRPDDLREPGRRSG